MVDTFTFSGSGQLSFARKGEQAVRRTIWFSPAPYEARRYALRPVSVEVDEGMDFPYHTMDIAMLYNYKYRSLLPQDEGLSWEKSLARILFFDNSVRKVFRTKEEGTFQKGGYVVWERPRMISIILKNPDSLLFCKPLNGNLADEKVVKKSVMPVYRFVFDSDYILLFGKRPNIDICHEQEDTILHPAIFKGRAKEMVQSEQSFARFFRECRNIDIRDNGIRVLCSSTQYGYIEELYFHNDSQGRKEIIDAFASVNCVQLPETVGYKH